MMQYEWLLLNNLIQLKCPGGETYVPTAVEIFNHIFKGITTVGPYQPDRNLVNCFPEIKYSRYPIFPRLQLNSTRAIDTLGIEAKIIVKQINDIHEISTTLLTAGHLILNSTWYPFDPGAVEEIKELLRATNIVDLNNIKLRQYVDLLSRTKGQDILDDLVPKTIIESDGQQVGENTIPLFKGKLYPYQATGYSWLKMIADEDAGCILGDEMGLGKTIQVIALLARETATKRTPSLVIAPVTLAENWRREITRFAPEIHVLIHQGQSRSGLPTELRQTDVVITSYDTAIRDLSLFRMIKWNIVLLDEAQAIKNPAAKRSKSIKLIPRRVSIAVTGTPVENRLTDLWSITDFAFNGFLGNLNEFESEYAEKEITGAEALATIVSPIILRRRVAEVAKDLPERIDIPQVLGLSTTESQNYELLRQQILREHGNKASLVALVKLRMFCTHPFLLSKEKGDPNCTAKYLRLTEVVDEIVSSQEKVLIFTSFTKMADILTEDLGNRFGIKTGFIDGRVNVSSRQHIIDAFSSEKDFSVLVLNPRAAGAGLNITAANHVIHYNLEWNPAIEDQASARAYRRGQTRPVTIHRLYYADTVDEVINERIARKRILADTAVVGTDGNQDEYTDILKALNISPLCR